MADKEKEATQTKESTEAKAPDKKSDLMAYVIVGVGALLVTIGVLFALMDSDTNRMSQSDAYDKSQSDSKHGSDDSKSAGHSSSKKADNQAPDLFAELEDLSFLDDTVLFGEAIANAEKLDAALDVTSGGKRISKKDSSEAVDWITAEKKKISEERTALNKRKKRLDAQERSIDQKLRQVDQAEAGRLNRLAKLYDGMKPDQVARMISKLEDKMIVSILPRMKPANASKIMGLMPPARGARISKQMITLAGN
ncbi:MAG: hypothetical protein IH914_09575 [candidate division Zixibacteria bacterium]|nr:hypothetical protein [candidate division Zixibacteria bacterium]